MTLSWADARTLGDLGELTARWLEGDHPGLFGYEGAPDTETAELIPALVAMNRAGYVTECSQPGWPIKSGGGQRAAVSGYCSEQVAERISYACLPTRLLALSYWPGCEDRLMIPMTLYEGRMVTVVGSAVPSAESYRGVLHDDALRAVVDAWQVAVIDPCWGTNDLLWDTVVSALTAPASPPFSTLYGAWDPEAEW